MNRLPTILLALLDSLSNLSYTWCYSIFKVLLQARACNGGEYRVRTCDPLRARQVLSQLS